jgi:putative RNA 2'-phosphotransferase
MNHKSSEREVKISKFLSLVLRHKPEKIGIELDQNGWISIPDLLKACSKHKFYITPLELQTVVTNNDKQRFSISEDGTKIRANQGHSIAIELGYIPIEPPEILYHGTAERFLSSILNIGLVKGNRHHVHMSSDRTAHKVGSRHGKPVILEIMSIKMHQQGYQFYQSENGVWLVDHVPAIYLKVLN